MIHRPLCLLLLAVLLPGASFAQSSTTSDAEVIPRYDVEIVIFKNLNVPKDKEFVLPVTSPGKGDPVFDISSPKSVAAAGKLGYELLGVDNFRLMDVVARLIESPRYDLLLHAAWRQPGLEREQVMPVWVRGGRIFGIEYTSIDSSIDMFDNNTANDVAAGEAKTFEFDEQTLKQQKLKLQEQKSLLPPPHDGLYELEGKITVALSRYLHTYTDLVLRRPRLSEDTLDNAAEQTYLQAHLADTRILNNHLMREHRRMRSKNLHYIDNPEFGMLILITPYEVAKGFVEAPIEETPTEAQPEAEVPPVIE
jgi:hypothetical protein